MKSENFSQSLHIPGSYFLRKKEFLLQKNGSIKEQSLKMYIYEMRLKNWIERINEMSKIWEKNSKANVLHIFAFAFQIVSDNLQGKPKWSQKSAHNVSRIPLTNVENKSKWRRLMSSK